MWDVLPVADLITQTFGCTNVVGEWPTSQCPSGWYHSGIDLGAAVGGWSIFRSPVYATRSGYIVRVGYPNGLGPQAVFLQVDGGPCLIYGHLDQATVAVNQRVNAGDQVGLLGTKGFSLAPHLHFEARADGPRQPVSGQDPITGTLDPTPYLTHDHKEELMLIFLGPDGTQYLLSGDLFVHIPSVPDSNALQAAGVKLVSVDQPFIDNIKAAAAETALPITPAKLSGTITGTLA